MEEQLMNDKQLEWTIKIQSIAQAGLTYSHDSYTYGVIKFFVLCKVIKGTFEKNIKTIGIKYFNQEELPDNLAIEKTSKEQILMCFEAQKNENWKVQFD